MKIGVIKSRIACRSLHAYAFLYKTIAINMKQKHDTNCHRLCTIMKTEIFLSFLLKYLHKCNCNCKVPYNYVYICFVVINRHHVAIAVKKIY